MHTQLKRTWQRHTYCTQLHFVSQFSHIKVMMMMMLKTQLYKAALILNSNTVNES